MSLSIQNVILTFGTAARILLPMTTRPRKKIPAALRARITLYFTPAGDGRLRVAAVLTMVWALVAGLVLRPVLWNGMIVDERSYYAKFVPDSPGAMVIAENWSADVGFQLTQRAAKDLAAGRSYFVDITKPDELLPTFDGEGVYVVINSLGIAGVGAGLEVVMVDPPSLGDPIGSRLVLPPDSAREAALVPGTRVYRAQHLLDVVQHFQPAGTHYGFT